MSGRPSAPSRIGVLCNASAETKLSMLHLWEAGEVCWLKAEDANPDRLRALVSRSDLVLLDVDDRLAHQTLPSLIGGATRGQRLIDLGMRSYSGFMASSADCQAAGLKMFGCTWHRPAGETEAGLLVDDSALADPQVAALLSQIARRLRICGGPGSAKAFSTLLDLMTAAIGLVDGEALSLGVAAGLDLNVLLTLLQRGSGSNALLSALPADVPAVGEALRGVRRGESMAALLDHSGWFASAGVAMIHSIDATFSGDRPIVEAATAWFDRHTRAH